MRAALDLVLPERCAICAAPGSTLCARCRASFVRLVPPLCERCGSPGPWPVRRCAECAGGGSPSGRRGRRSSTTARRGGSFAHGRSAAGDVSHATRRLLSLRSSRDRASTRFSPCPAIRSARGAEETSRRARSRKSWGGSGTSRRSRCSSEAARFHASADFRSRRDARTSAAASLRTAPFPHGSVSSTTCTPPARPLTPAPVPADGLEPGTFGSSLSRERFVRLRVSSSPRS